MSFADSVSTPLQVGRRFHARRRIDGLAYVEFGPDNGAILIDLGEGGLSFQSVMPVSMNQALLFKFKLPAASDYIEGYAEVAWINESGKGGGLRFVELSADACAQIREWTGVLSAPEAGALEAGNNTDSNLAQESPAEDVPARPMHECTTQDVTNGGDVPVQISEVLAPAESEQGAGLGPEANEAPYSAEGASEAVPADQAILPEALPTPEFTVEVTAASDSTEPLASQVEWAPLAAPPIPATSAVEIAVPESTLPNDSEPMVTDVAKTIESPEPAVAAPGTPARNAPVPASDERNLEPVQKPQRKQAPSKPESSLPSANRQDSAVRGSFVRQPQKPSPSATEWGKTLASPGDELKLQATLASQALKVGIGAAAGAGLMLALVFGVPSLVTRVQATANARTGGANLASSPVFQVEVADLNNRRWILKNGGEAGSPFNDTPSRHETQPAASARSESAKSSRSENS